MTGASRTITVAGLRAEGEGQEVGCDASNLSMLFRLQGPEALAQVPFCWMLGPSSGV